MQRTVVETDRAPAAIGPYSQGVRWGHLVFTAGQLGIDPSTGNFIGEGIREQTRQALENVKAVLQAADSSLANVVKVTVFLADMAEFGLMNEVYASYFDRDPPARSAVQVAALPKGGRVEIEAVAIAD